MTDLLLPCFVFFSFGVEICLNVFLRYNTIRKITMWLLKKRNNVIVNIYVIIYIVKKIDI